MLLYTVLLFFGAISTLAAPPGNSSVQGDSSYFLPDNAIIPESYKITIDVTKSFDEIEKRKFLGDVEIKGIVKKNVKEIVLHAVNITITNEIQVNGKIATYSTETLRQFLTITPASDIKLNNGTTITIKISYIGELQKVFDGFYTSKYEEDNKEKYVLATQFEPVHARKAFPCFDEPKYKATFELTFKKQKQYKILSNMNVPDNGRGLEIVTFPVTPKMSTYLVAFIVSDFQYKESPYDKRFKVWSRRNAINQTKWAANYVYNITSILNKFTGIEYNKYMPKMDMAALPGFSTVAMENWGLLTYREKNLLVDDERSTYTDIFNVITTIAHEITHQWFGNLVTCHWWSNTWLNEGFARYFEYFATAEVLPSWEMENQFVVRIQQSVFGVDALAKTTPLTLPVFTPSKIILRFDEISYCKGGSVIRMMANFLGNKIFQEGLRNYLQINQETNTEPNDLWNAIQEIIDKNNVTLEYPLNKIMDTWINQPGYPVISIKSSTPGYYELSQQRFYINPEENKAKQNWFVPISYTNSSEMNFKNTKPNLWLTPNEPTKIIAEDKENDFIIVNIQETGYYRVNYDENLWKKIAKALASEDSKIHLINKAQIVDDVLNLARSNQVEYPIAFDVIDYLISETDYFPWYVTFVNFRYLLQCYSDNEDTGKELRLYLKNLMSELMKDKEFEKNENEIKELNRVQSLIWSCKLDHEKCVSQATGLFKKYKSTKYSEKNIIPKKFRFVIFCTALRHGNKTDWEFFWKKYIESNNTAEKIDILNVLGCSSDEQVLKSYLEKSLNSNDIRKQDASHVFSSVYSNGKSKGVDVAFQFLKEKYEKIKAAYNGTNDLESVTLGLVGRLTDEKKIEEFKKILQNSDNFATFREAFKIVDHNVAWAKKYRKTIGSFLNNKRTGAEATAGILANKYVIS